MLSELDNEMFFAPRESPPKRDLAEGGLLVSRVADRFGD